MQAPPAGAVITASEKNQSRSVMGIIDSINDIIVKYI